MRYALLATVLAPVFLAACGAPSLSRWTQPSSPEVTPVVRPVQETLDPTPPPPPPPAARTASQFDTTTAEDRAEALAVTPAPASERKLGTVVGSLGAPTDPGIWIKTPLVTTLTPGRVEVVATGKSANIELRAGSGGTQISLPAMRLLEIPLTDLPEITLYAK